MSLEYLSRVAVPVRKELFYVFYVSARPDGAGGSSSLFLEVSRTFAVVTLECNLSRRAEDRSALAERRVSSCLSEDLQKTGE